jgi:parallel beta-helix repeat protein
VIGQGIRPSRRRAFVAALLLCCVMIGGGAMLLDANASPCPRDSIAVEPGASIQMAVDSAGDGAVFCLKNGVHRAQAVRPRPRQRFYGEGRTVLNGSRVVTGFVLEEGHWMASTHLDGGSRHGQCLPSAPACDRPEALFLDDRPLSKVSSRRELAGGTVYVDYAHGRIYLFDDPTNRKVELTAARFAFESAAADVSIGHMTVEKFASVAQKGAIHAREGARWSIENCEVRLNSGAGISVGTGSRVRNCNVHHNGQIGIEGNGKDIQVENCRIWSNNVYGFDPTWQAGGVKIALSDGLAFRGNHVHDNHGPGLWCDIDCRNVIYEGNLVKNNQFSGIFHETSFNAVIRKNVLQNNGWGDRGWFWGADITVAASQNVEVTGNKVSVIPGGCGIMLIDQGRRRRDGGLYKTRDNVVSANEMTFEGGACAGGVSDTKPQDENYGIISDGNNRFDGNTYRVGRPGEPARFVWGNEVTDWEGFRRRGLEGSGRLVPF